MGSPPFERTLLKDRAYDYIKGLILDGSYEPGCFISERELSAQLQMSKTPVRAALERLAEQGFVTIAPQRGVIVRALSSREIADHYDFRMALESWIMRTMAGRLNADDVRQLRENLATQQRQVSGDNDIRGFTESDAAFHIIITQATGNAEFERAMAHQRDKVQLVVEQIAFRDPTVPPHSYAEHRGIFDALMDGDGDLASRLVVEHLEHGKKFLLMGGTYGQ